MGMINCDTEGLTNKVLPPLNSGCDDLDSAENIISSIIVPIGFDYSNEVYRMSNKINSIKEDISDINEWVLSVIFKFENAEKENKSLLENILNWFGISTTEKKGAYEGLESARKEALAEKKLMAEEKMEEQRVFYDFLHQYAGEDFVYEWEYESWNKGGISGYLKSWPEGMDISECKYVYISFHGQGENAASCPASPDNADKFYKKSFTYALQEASLKPHVFTIEVQRQSGDWIFGGKSAQNINKSVAEIVTNEMETNGLDVENTIIIVGGYSFGSIGAESFTKYAVKNLGKDFVNKAVIYEGGQSQKVFKELNVPVTLCMSNQRWKKEEKNPKWIKEYGEENVIRFGANDIEMTDNERAGRSTSW